MMDYMVKYGDKLAKAIFVHIEYVLISVLLGSLIAILIGIVLSHYPRVSKVVLPVIGVFQTIPGIVFIGILFVYIGMNPMTVVIALAIYAIFPVLKNTITGLTNVEFQYVEAARGCGMNALQILFRVKLPLAMSSIISGIRMSTIYTVSWAVLAAMIGQGGLGEFIYIGIDTNVKEYIVLGAIPAALLAIAFGWGIDRIQISITPRGLRRRGVK